MPKFEKLQIVLALYDKLIKEGKVIMNDFISEYEISVRSFRRYVSEINTFFCNEFMNEEIVYDYAEKAYKIK